VLGPRQVSRDVAGTSLTGFVSRQEVPGRKVLPNLIAKVCALRRDQPRRRSGSGVAERVVRQAVHAERRVVHKAKDTAPADYPSAPASQAMKLPYDAFRA
jgi:hypothetical protein